MFGALPTTSGGLKYCVVALDYLTKWVETEPLAIITSENVQKFVWKNIICRFGCSKIIVADNDAQFTSASFKTSSRNLASKFISPRWLPPQSDGQVEVSNKIIKEGIKKRLDKIKERWPGELSYILWRYRTTLKKATEETPY